MAADNDKKYYCEKCNRTMGGVQFYTSNNLEKYPNDGKFTMCKKCLTMFVDNWKPETFLWILQEADVPWVPEQWDKLMATYAKDPKKVNGTTILGRYLAKMKLNQWKDYRWKDTEFLQKLNQAERERTMKEQGYDVQEIALANKKAEMILPEVIEMPQELAAAGNPLLVPNPADLNDQNLPPQDDGEDIDLTDEDRLYLRLKWGKNYRPDEWVWLEQLYNEMMESYDIQTAGHIDTLKLICKTSLKCNQLIDIGDVDGFQKVSRVYDSLMKSGRFTAAQNKAENGEFVDSVSELFMLCEKEGFVPRYYIDKPNDKVDETIEDLQRYTHRLVTEETNLGNLIEDALKQITKEDEEDSVIQDGINNLLDDDEDAVSEIEQQLKDNDFQEYNDFLENEELTDADLLEFLSNQKEG